MFIYCMFVNAEYPLWTFIPIKPNLALLILINSERSDVMYSLGLVLDN
jgi:hypothetical protein